MFLESCYPKTEEEQRTTLLFTLSFKSTVGQAGLIVVCGLVAGILIAESISMVLTPLCLAILFWRQQQRQERAMLWLFLWFFAYHIASLSWMAWALDSPSQWSFAWAACLLYAVFALHALVYPGIFLVLNGAANLLRKVPGVNVGPLIGPMGRAFIFGTTILLSDLIRTQGDFGIAWGFVGYSQVDNPLLKGIFPVIGIYGVSGLLGFLAAYLTLFVKADVLLEGRPEANRFLQQRRALAGIFIGIVIGMLLLGRIEWTSPEGPPMLARSVHTHLPDSIKYDPPARQASEDLLLELSAMADVSFTLYPELFLVSPAYTHGIAWRQQIIHAVARSNNHQLIGMPDAIVDSKGALLGLSNSVVQIGPSGVIARRPKEKLIPFAEQAEFTGSGLLDFFLQVFNTFPNSNFTPSGQGNTSPFFIHGIPMSVSICSEIVNPLIVHSRGEAAKLLLSASSESWIRSRILDGLIVRAVKARVLESQKPMFRSANVGLSGYIDASGSIREFNDLHTVYLVQPHSGNTPFVLWMGWLYRMTHSNQT